MDGLLLDGFRRSLFLFIFNLLGILVQTNKAGVPRTRLWIPLRIRHHQRVELLKIANLHQFVDSEIRGANSGLVGHLRLVLDLNLGLATAVFDLVDGREVVSFVRDLGELGVCHRGESCCGGNEGILFAI